MLLFCQLSECSAVKCAVPPASLRHDPVYWPARRTHRITFMKVIFMNTSLIFMNIRVWNHLYIHEYKPYIHQNQSYIHRIRSYIHETSLHWSLAFVNMSLTFMNIRRIFMNIRLIFTNIKRLVFMNVRLIFTNIEHKAPKKNQCVETCRAAKSSLALLDHSGLEAGSHGSWENWSWGLTLSARELSALVSASDKLCSLSEFWEFPSWELWIFSSNADIGVDLPTVGKLSAPKIWSWIRPLWKI